MPEWIKLPQDNAMESKKNEKIVQFPRESKHLMSNNTIKKNLKENL